jgi:GxxExxY protein
MDVAGGNVVASQDRMEYDEPKIDALRGTVIGCAIEVHRELGPGLLESVYQTCMTIELRSAGLRVEANKKVPLHYHGQPIDERLFIDLLVQDVLVLEVKSVERLAAIHTAQVITYLKLADKPVGLLLNFNCVLMKEGIRRIVHPAIVTTTGLPSRHIRKIVP